MIGALDAIKIGAGALVGASLCFAPAYFIGKREGRQEAAAAAIANTVKALETRGETDEKITNGQAVGLCRYFGLQSADVIECVRRLEETNAVTGNSGVDHQPR